MTNKTLNLDQGLYRYLLGHSLRETAVQRRLREATAQLPEAQMQIAPEQGQFMQLLVRLTGARTIVELGTFTGYSALAMALALPVDGRLITCDLDQAWTAIARRYWAEAGVAEQIELRLGRALDTLAEMLAAGAAGTVDLVFIDADKKNYPAYYERALELLRPGGLVLIDNVLWGGAVADPGVTDAATTAIRALNDRLHHDARVDVSLLPLGDGLTLARKREG